MDGIKQENSEDTGDGVLPPVKRVLRSRIIEVDSNSNGSTVSNGVDGSIGLADGHHIESGHEIASKESLAVYSTPVKRSTRKRSSSVSCATPKRVDHKEVNSKSILEDKGKSSLAEDIESNSSLSPVSQCGSEASSVSLRVLRNKCVVIPLENCDKEVAARTNRAEDVQSKKVDLSCIDEENDDKEHDVNVSNRIEEDSCMRNKNEREGDDESANSDFAVDKNNKLQNMKGKDNLENDNLPVTHNSGVDECEKITDNENNHEDDSNNVLDPAKSCEDETNLERVEKNITAKSCEDETNVERVEKNITEETEDTANEAVKLHLSTKESQSEIQNNEPVLDCVNTVSNEKLIDDDHSKTNEINVCDEDSDTNSTLEFDSSNILKNVTKRKPVSNDVCIDNNINFNKNENGECIEKESSETCSEIEKVNSDEVQSDTIDVSETQENSIVQTVESALSETINEPNVSEESVPPDEVSKCEIIDSTVEDETASEKTPIKESRTSPNNSPNKLGISNLELNKVVSGIEIENVDDPILLARVEESVDIESLESSMESISGIITETDVQHTGINENITKDEEIVKNKSRSEIIESDLMEEARSQSCVVLLEPEEIQTDKCRINLSNVLNLLDVDKSSKKKLSGNKRERLNSSSSSEESNKIERSGVKIKKHVSVDTNPVQYHGIGEDLLKDIIKEAVAGVFGNLREELHNVNQQLVNVTTLLNEIKRGKKRKFDEANIEDDINDNAAKESDKQSVSSLSSAMSTIDELILKVSPPKQDLPSPSKITKTKEDLIKELLEDVSDHLQVPVKKKKRKLSESLIETKKNKKGKKLICAENTAVCGSVSTANPDSDGKNLNKRKKKKKLKLLDQSVFSSDTLPSSSVIRKNKTDNQTSEQDLLCFTQRDIDSGELLHKKKKKKVVSENSIPHKNVMSQASDKYIPTIDDISEMASSKVTEKKKKKKEKFVVTLPEEILVKKKKKKSKLNSNVVNTAWNNSVNNVNDMLFTSSGENETDKKKHKKIKTKDKFNDISLVNSDKDNNFELNFKKNKLKKVGPDNLSNDLITFSSELKKKKKKKQKLQNEHFAASQDASFNTNNVFGDSTYLDEENLIKKMKSWKSTNKNKSYRVTPYKEKNKKTKFGMTVD